MWGLVLLAIAGGAAVVRAVRSAGSDAAPSGSSDSSGFRIPEHAHAWLPFFRAAGQARGVPVDVALAFAFRESKFQPTAYNPEPGAMAVWAEKIATRPQKWGANPEFVKAKEVHRRLEAGEATGKDIAAADKGKPFAEKLWTFGSVGIMQVTRISADAAGYVAARPNAGLFDPATNIAAGVGEIAIWRSIMFKGREPGELDDEDWATVRAAYVMGGGNVAKYPEKAEEKRVLFRSALKAVRPQVTA